ncbi:MAG: DUF4139 domain-containing protein [Bacteroidota bacterium]|nr:DUF4139 domain-containing protein [Bacteroidota bacterium]
MKRIILLTSLISAMIICQAQPETILQTKPDRITVYTSAAEIHRTEKFSLSKGMQQIVFDSLSPQINANSLQVSGKGNFTILDTHFRMHQINPLNANSTLPPKIQSAIDALEDSIRLVSYSLRPITDQLEVLNMEKNLMLNNQLVRGNGGDTIPELKQTMHFFRDKLNDINNQKFSLEKEKYPIDKKLAAMNSRLNKLITYNQRNENQVQQAVPQIVVQVIGNQSATAELEISYLVNNAGWSPSYDIRAKDDESISLIYKAKVYQNTQKNWDDVKLTLSTANPQQHHQKPSLPIWYLNYNQQYRAIYNEGHKRESRIPTAAQNISQTNEVATYTNQFVEQTANMLNLSYDIDLSFSISGDGTQHTVPVLNKTLGSEFTYYAAPAMDRNAFLLAKITDWKDVELLSGQANIYFNGKYNGLTQLYPQNVNDSIEIPLGKSQRVSIDRKKISEETENTLVGSFVKKTIEYEIKINNLSNQTINLILEDRIPLSNNDDIEVKLLKSDGAEFNEKNAHLTWDLTIPANQKKTIKFSFCVKYDSKQNLNILCIS